MYSICKSSPSSSSSNSNFFGENRLFLLEFPRGLDNDKDSLGELYFVWIDCNFNLKLSSLSPLDYSNPYSLIEGYTLL